MEKRPNKPKSSPELAGWEFGRITRWYQCQKIAQILYHSKVSNEKVEAMYNKSLADFNKATQ